MKLILWDIDGTLIHGDRAGEHALIAALREMTGREGSLEGIELAGRTDVSILQEVFKAHELPLTEEARHRFIELYLKHLAVELPRRQGRPHPGILGILERIDARPDLVQGLLTGNLERGARIKLEHFKVWHYFEFGAFADDSSLRNELGPHALRRAHARHGHDFKPEEVFIVGDTPHDVACAKAIGARSIAVATGRYTIADLAACEPTAVLADLSDSAPFFAVIEGVA